MRANEFVAENLRDWFKDKWVRFGPDGKIRGDCARGDDSEGKPKCLPQSKAHSLGKKGRASAGARKRREDPNPERSGRAINVNTKKKSNEGVAEGLEHYNGIEISMEKEDDEIMVTAMMSGGRELGHVLFVIDGEYLAPQDLEVDERYQGQGIAATMYDYVKSKGYKIRRSGQQTDAGAGFWGKHKPGKNVWEQGVAEGLSEARNSLFAFVKQQFPTWPDYVLKDFLYQQAKGIRDQAELDDFLKRNKQDFGNCKWTLTKLPITFDIFTPKTRRMLASREGGSSNPFQVPRDAERHAQQSQMIQQKGVSAEPIIVAKLSNGYDLIEGWHRTIQHLKAFPQGYTGPAWVCTGATYKSESVEQGLAEEQLDELKCWDGYTRVQGVPAGAPGSCKKKTNEEQHSETCPHCGGEMVSEELMNEKQDACYYKVKSRYKVWPSAYASGALVQCRKKGASNWGTGGKGK